MKRLLIFALLSVTVLTGCKKQIATPVSVEPAAALPGNATVASTGKLVFANESTDGSLAKIYLQKDGVYVLGLEQMNYQTSFGDTNIYLSDAAQLSASSIKVFSAKKLHGNIYTPLISVNSIKQFKYVIIQADTDSEPAATAQLQ